MLAKNSDQSHPRRVTGAARPGSSAVGRIGPKRSYPSLSCRARQWSPDSLAEQLQAKTGKFSAAFFLACLAVLELEGVVFLEI
jgi:hypothetical protein